MVSIGAIDAESGPMDFDLAEAEFAQAALQQGDEGTIVTDHTKFGRRGLVRVCPFDGFDRLITDKTPPPEIADQFRAGGVEIEIS